MNMSLFSPGQPDSDWGNEPCVMVIPVESENRVENWMVADTRCDYQYQSVLVCVEKENKKEK